MANRKFKTEVADLLHLIIHSLYSNKEIFLRELISNASDAIDKLRYLSLTDEKLKGFSFNPRIDISFTEEGERTLTISDNGIGMSEADLNDNLGTIASSGTKKFLASLTDEQKKKGVIACSAGNHAQGVALAASRQGIDSLICLPAGAPISKVEATRSYGAKIELVKGVYDDAYNRALEIMNETGRTMIHPFDDEYVIAGQGTIALEILQQLPEADAIVVPVGGGGLISGVAFTAKMLKPSIKVYGVQATGAASMFVSHEMHEIHALQGVNTIADGIAVKCPGGITFPLVEKYVDDIVTVTDDEIAVAILDLMEKQKLVSEGAVAVAVAAALSGKIPTDKGRTVLLVSGGNIDVTVLSRVINRALRREGRLADITTELIDKPGQLVEVSSIIADAGANVTGVFHDKNGNEKELNNCTLRVTMETRDHAHIEEIKDALRARGFQLWGDA